MDPVPAQLLDPKTLAPGLSQLTQELIRRYKAETKVDREKEYAPKEAFSVLKSDEESRLRAFEGGIEPTDDLTVMALRYLGPGAG